MLFNLSRFYLFKLFTLSEVHVLKMSENGEETVCKTESVNGKLDQYEKITKREDLTDYFKKRDHSVNQLYQSEVRLSIN